MTLHAAEWLAGELIAVYLGARLILRAYRSWRKQQETDAYKADRGETTEHSSTQDD